MHTHAYERFNMAHRLARTRKSESKTQLRRRAPRSQARERCLGLMHIPALLGQHRTLCERKGTKANRLLRKTESANKNKCSMASLARTRASHIDNWLFVARTRTSELYWGPFWRRKQLARVRAMGLNFFLSLARVRADVICPTI